MLRKHSQDSFSLLTANLKQHKRYPFRSSRHLTLFVSILDINTLSGFNQNTIIRQPLRNLKSKSTITPLQNNPKMEWPKITLFGDSITRRSMDPDNGCWGSMISHRVGSYFDVDRRGFEGYNSRWALKLMPQLFPKSYLEKVEIFVPFFGHNDSLCESPLYVPLDEYEKNMDQIIKYLNDQGLEKRKIIMITPTWYHFESFKANGYELKAKELEDGKKYSDAVLRIANDNGIDVLDFFDISAKHEPLVDMFCDGIHYSKIGATLLFDSLMPIIEKKIEASFKKPVDDLYHVIPFDQRPDVKVMLSKILIKSKVKGQQI